MTTFLDNNSSLKETNKAPIGILGLCLLLSFIAHAGAFAFIPNLDAKKIEMPIKNLSINLVSLAAPSFEPQKIEPAAGTVKTPDIKIISKPKTKEVIAKPKSLVKDKPAPASQIVETKKDNPKTIQQAQPILSSNDQGAEKTSVIPLIKNSEILKQTPPTYPPRARRMGQQGTVLLHALVGQDGHTQDLKIFASSGYQSLDASAIKAVKTWKFASANKDGKPTKAWVEVPVKFVLR